MAKGPSEAAFGAALRGLDADLPILVYKPPDDARNRKPCDFMVWFRGHDAEWQPAVRAAWFEVKEVVALGRFNVNDLRPSQKAGIRDAGAIGIPYYVAVYWANLHSWTVSVAYKMLEHAVAEGNTSISRELLMSRFGIQSSPANLGSTLKDVLHGEFD